jgi:hypothetical protein
MTPEQKLEAILQLRQQDPDYTLSTAEMQQKLELIRRQLAALGASGLNVSDSELGCSTISSGYLMPPHSCGRSRLANS